MTEKRDPRLDADLIGQYFNLPDGQEVRVEGVNTNGTASVRRVGGDRHDTTAVVRIGLLLGDDESETDEN